MNGKAMSLSRYSMHKGNPARRRMKRCLFFVPFLFILTVSVLIVLVDKGKGTKKK